MKMRSSLALVFLAVVASTLESSFALADTRAKARCSTPPAVTHTIFVREDGSFFPATHIDPRRRFSGLRGPACGTFAPGLSTTFSVVRAKLADIEANVACMTTTRATTSITTILSSTTSSRARSTEAARASSRSGRRTPLASLEGPLADQCDQIGANAGTAPVLRSEEWAGLRRRLRHEAVPQSRESARRTRPARTRLRAPEHLGRSRHYRRRRSDQLAQLVYVDIVR